MSPVVSEPAHLVMTVPAVEHSWEIAKEELAPLLEPHIKKVLGHKFTHPNEVNVEFTEGGRGVRVRVKVAGGS